MTWPALLLGARASGCRLGLAPQAHLLPLPLLKAAQLEDHPRVLLRRGARRVARGEGPEERRKGTAGDALELLPRLPVLGAVGVVPHRIVADELDVAVHVAHRGVAPLVEPLGHGAQVHRLRDQDGVVAQAERPPVDGREEAGGAGKLAQIAHDLDHALALRVALPLELLLLLLLLQLVQLHLLLKLHLLLLHHVPLPCGGVLLLLLKPRHLPLRLFLQQLPLPLRLLERLLPLPLQLLLQLQLLQPLLLLLGLLLLPLLLHLQHDQLLVPDERLEQPREHVAGPARSGRRIAPL